MFASLCWGGGGGGSTCFYSACLFFIPYLCWQDVHDVKDNWKSQNRGCCGNRHLYFCRSLIYDSGNGNFDFALSVFVCIVLVILCIWMSDVWSRRGLQLQFCLVSEWESVDKFENVNIVVFFLPKYSPYGFPRILASSVPQTPANQPLNRLVLPAETPSGAAPLGNAPQPIQQQQVSPPF